MGFPFSISRLRSRSSQPSHFLDRKHLVRFKFHLNNGPMGMASNQGFPMPMISLLVLRVLTTTASLHRRTSAGTLFMNWPGILRLTLDKLWKIVEISVGNLFRPDRWRGHRQQGLPRFQFDSIQINDCTDQSISLT